MKKYNIEYNIEKHNHNYFSVNNESKKQFYLAGMLLGKSSIKNNEISITNKNLKQLEIFKEYKMTNGSIQNNKSSYKMSIASSQMVEDLKRFGITSNKNNEYNMPNYLLNHKYLVDFLRGRFDVKGFMLPNIIEITGSIEFLEQLKTIFIKFTNIKSSPKILSRANKNSNRIIYTGESSKHIYNWLYIQYGDYSTA